MGREIKFRAWDKNYSYMEYEPVKENFIDFDGTVYEKVEKSGFGQCWDDYEKADQYILMQYTGLLDKNGKEVYEGDVLKIIDSHATVFYSNQYLAYYIEWTGIESGTALSVWNPNQLEVIGNIYESEGE